MAHSPNVDRKDGFTPSGLIFGLSFAGNIRLFSANGSDADIYRGDLVTAQANGMLDQYAAADVDSAGVFLGMSGVELRSVGNTEALGYYDASEGASDNLLVCLGFGLLSEIQEDGLGTALVAADRYANRELIVDNSNNNTITGLSGMEINSDSGTTSLTLPIKIFDIVDRPDNQLASVDASLPNARWTVYHNHSIFAPAGRVGI